MLRYPAGTRPFKSPLEQHELDEEWSKTKEEPFTFQVQIEKGASRRRAMQKIHRGAAEALRSIDVENIKTHNEALSKKVSKVAFVETCASFCKDPGEEDNTCMALGIDAPKRKAIDMKAVEEFVYSQ